MNLEKVAYLLTAIEAGSFSLAAEKLGMTQSGLNRQISSLEEELKTTLLLRGRRGVVPAKGAEPVIARLRELLAAEKRVAEEINAVKGLLTGSLAIGSYFSISTSWLPPLLKDFSDRYPAIELSTFEAADEELVKGLREGTLDCAFLSRHSYDGDFFELMETEFVAWLPPGHRLAAAESVTPEEIAAEPFIYPRMHSNSDIDDFFLRHRTRPRIHLTTNDPYSAWAMVNAGLGVSVNNRLQSVSLKGNVVQKRFRVPERVTLGLALPSLDTASPALMRLVTMARTMAEGFADGPFAEALLPEARRPA
ncbi:LysR family transcriptional regulator [Sutterella sp.]|uniref:LysR family transcriptional regulator n=1 Tax=Sutterella sp. TaxID=1981025 RepID=UPI0026E0B9E3|nr:LysR family transcriptional regulator [Sutterella sp.]MDO5532083.1 LysR family transcriptional regulator [Sutterella sp.]